MGVTAQQAIHVPIMRGSHRGRSDTVGAPSKAPSAACRSACPAAGRAAAGTPCRCGCCDCCWVRGDCIAEGPDSGAPTRNSRPASVQSPTQAAAAAAAAHRRRNGVWQAAGEPAVLPPATCKCCPGRCLLPLAASGAAAMGCPAAALGWLGRRSKSVGRSQPTMSQQKDSRAAACPRESAEGLVQQAETMKVAGGW